MNLSPFAPVFNPNFRLTAVLPPHLECTSWGQMLEITEPGVNFALLRRPLPPVHETVNEIMASSFEGVQGAVDSPEEIEELAAYFDEELDLKAPDAFHFFQDIMTSTENFFAISGASRVGVKLEKVITDSCRLLHVDRLGLRLITTYEGVATEWLRNENVLRSGLGKGDNALVMRPGSKVEKMEAGWIGIMKGDSLANQGNGFVHRSPAVESWGGRRLVLRIDTIS